METVYVGDIIPTKDGWPETPEPWRTGLQVTDIQITAKYHGWIVSVKPVDGSAGHKQFVSLDSPYFYGDFWTDDVLNLVPQQIRRNLANASGRYRSIDTGKVTRFKITGRAGRPPKGDILTAFPPGAEEWSRWLLLDMGQSHPNDPRA
jgi:hypothetical protein